MQYSVVTKNDAHLTPNFRLDAEFFEPTYLLAEKKVFAKKGKRLGTLIDVLTDYHANGSYEILKGNVELFDEPDYALMIRTVDFERDNFETDVKYVSEHAYNFLKKTKVFGGEIIINKIGNAGRAYLVPPLDKKISLGMNQFMIRPKQEIDSYFLYVYLTSGLGELLLKRRVTGAVPLSIDKESVRSVPVPFLSEEFQKLIHTLVESHFSSSNNAKAIYSEAEKLLLAELELSAWKPKHQLSFVKKYSDSVNAERFDAEYFQPKYEEIVQAVNACKGGFAELGEITTIKKCVEPGSEAYLDDGIPFVRVSNLSKFEISNNNQQFISETLYKELADYQPKKDEILLSKDATPGIAYHLSEDPGQMIPSGGILRLKIKNKAVLPEYLTLVLNSSLVQNQIIRDAGGSIINHWRPDQVKSTLIPILDISKQEELKVMINKSFSARIKSKALLEIAKQGVEMAIERSEEEAMAWLKENLDKIESLCI